MLHIMGVPTLLGIPAVASTRGPRQLRRQGLLDALLQAGCTPSDHGDVTVPSAVPGEMPARSAALLGQVLEVAEQQSDLVVRHWRHGDLLLTLGGDHTTAIGSIMGLRKAGADFDVLWVDAHADFNTPETSPSGNPHGMPLALLCGLTSLMPGCLQPDRLRLLGIRDVDPGEGELLRQHRVFVAGVTETMKRLDTIIEGLGERVFISFDLDSVDPSLSPGVSTPVPGGFSVEQALAIVRAVAERRQLVGLDIVELNPERDQEDRSAEIGVAVAREAVLAQKRREELESAAD